MPVRWRAHAFSAPNQKLPCEIEIFNGDELIDNLQDIFDFEFDAYGHGNDVFVNAGN